MSNLEETRYKFLEILCHKTRMRSIFKEYTHTCLLLLFFIHLSFISISKAKTQTLSKKNSPLNHSVSAIFVFGDSTSDPGNNNYIGTPFKGNFPPYGRDFTNQVPTGRFSNGLLANDFLSRYLGVKNYIPPYLDPTLTIEELMTGVSFASAGSGFDPLTPAISNVIPLMKQVEYFKEYKSRVSKIIGKKRTNELICNALFVVSAGTNDFVVNYFSLPVRRKSYSVPSYMDFLLKNIHHFMQNLFDEGARKIGVASLPPMGCLPIVITLYSDNAVLNRDCIEYFSSLAQSFNSVLKNELNVMQLNKASFGVRIGYLDTFGPLKAMIVDNKFGFEQVNVGCCGTGLLEATFLCNPKTFVCPDATKYVFFDSIHPTEKTYSIVSKSLEPAIDSIIQE